MTTTLDTRDPARRPAAIREACAVLRRGLLVVLPTDTVYGVAADAFSPSSVAALLRAKGRGPDLPVPVLVGAPATLHGVAAEVSAAGRALAEAFWPGALTLVCHEQPSLTWDLGRTGGTVAVRMPLHPVALEVLREVGPLAVSSANRSGAPAARTAAQAREQLGAAVALYLEAARTASDLPSTIVDVTGATPRVLRMGAVGLDALREVVPQTEPVASDRGGPDRPAR